MVLNAIVEKRNRQAKHDVERKPFVAWLMTQTVSS